MNLTKEQIKKLGLVDERKDFYFKVENSVIDGMETTDEDGNKTYVEMFGDIYEKMVFITLSRYCNNNKVAFPSIPKIAEKCICGVSKVKESIKSLESKGFISKVSRKKEGTESNDTNLYAVKNIDKSILGVSISVKGRSCGDRGVGRVATEGRSCGDHNKEIVKNNKLNNNKIDRSESDNAIKKESINQDRVKFKEGYLKYIELVSKVTGKHSEQIKQVISPSLLRDINLDELLKNISESDYLQGLTENKPSINNYSTKTSLNRILIGFYSNKVSTKSDKVVKPKLKEYKKEEEQEYEPEF